MLHTNSVVYGLHDTLLAAVCSNYASVHMSQRHTVIVLSVINPRPEGYGSVLSSEKSKKAITVSQP